MPNEMVNYAKLIAADPGPICPGCLRDRGSHTMFCAIPEYVRETEAWHKRIEDAMAGDSQTASQSEGV